ncbi:MAG TPA: DNA polymerase III subunit delta' [Vicinamibacterales bacterium]|nr:DNA polymerase III subunit delta' [Vicinamibacterales bacterium]
MAKIAFRDITGHRLLLELIARAAVRGTLPPSVIFAGPEGVGKRLAAVSLAQVMNCLALKGTDAVDACGKCAACTRIARGVHADVLVVEPGDTGTIKIDQVRDAVERSAYRPFEGRRRVVIIDNAESLNAEAQNALLKTLEEPPAASTFVLVTSRPDVLLPTVVSRCQRLRFGRLAPAEIAEVLIRDHEYAEADAHAAAALSDGSIGRALEGGTDEFVDARQAAASLLETVATSSDPRRRLSGAKALTGSAAGGSDREELARRLYALSSIIRDLGALLSRADERCLANGDLQPLLERLRRSFDSDRVLRAFSAVDRALAALDRNASPKIVADWLAFQI